MLEKLSMGGYSALHHACALGIIEIHILILIYIHIYIEIYKHIYMYPHICL
jgi:hypothetical protein